MATSQIEQALVTLVPSINSLPDELVQLANALLIQSKSKAVNLKPEEEIGRAYACANIACERLKLRLGLEKLQPRPPVPPRIYKKLFTFLNQTLATPATPRTQRQIDAFGTRSGEAGTPGSRGTNRSGKPTPKTPSKTPAPPATALEISEETPSRRSEKRQCIPSAKIVENAATGVSATSGMRKRRKVSHDIEVPPYAEDMAKMLCSTFNFEREAPRLMEGLTSILHDTGLDTSSSDTTPANGSIPISQLPSLMITLTLYLATAISGTEVRPEQLETQKLLGISCVQDTLSGYPNAVSDPATITDDEMHVLVSHFLRRAVADSWLSMPWYTSLSPASLEDDDDDDTVIPAVRTAGQKGKKTPLRRKEKHAPRPADAADSTGGFTARTVEEELAGSRAGLLPGLGTMFQDALDWLAEDRVVRYLEWEKDIRSQISEMEGTSASAAATTGGVNGQKGGRRKTTTAASQPQAGKEGRVRGIVREIEKRTAGVAST